MLCHYLSTAEGCTQHMYVPLAFNHAQTEEIKRISSTGRPEQ